MRRTIRVLVIGDVVGNIGCMMIQKHLKNLKEQLQIDATIVNGENSNQNGRGISSKIMHAFKQNGVNVVSTGNHIWDNQDIYEYLRNNHDIVRPANFPSSCPGSGVTTFNCDGIEIAVVNIQGRIFMKENLDCPFLTLDTILNYLKHRTKIIIVDVHAEATAEKICLGYYLDGRVSCIVGTHTHVQTADERILPQGSAYITDLGMTGSLNSSIGMKKDIMIEKFKTQMPHKFIVETEPPVIMTGIWVEIDTQTGKALQIQRVKIIDQDLKA